MHQRGLFLLTSGCLIVAALRSLSCPFRSPIDQRWIKRITFLCSKASKLQSGLICQKSCLISCGRPAEKRTLRAATSSAWTVREVVRDVAARCGLGEEIAGGLSRFRWLTDPAPSMVPMPLQALDWKWMPALGLQAGPSAANLDPHPRPAVLVRSIHILIWPAVAPARPPHHQKIPFPFLFLPSPASRRKRRCTHQRVESATARQQVVFFLLFSPTLADSTAPFPCPDRVLTRPPQLCGTGTFPVTVASIKSPENTSGVESDDQDPGLRLGGHFSGLTLGKCLVFLFFWLRVVCGRASDRRPAQRRRPRHSLLGPAMHLYSTCRRVGACPTTSDHGILDRSVR